MQILHTRVTGMGVRFQYVIFCTNITYKGSRYKLRALVHTYGLHADSDTVVDFVNKNTNPEVLKSLSLQKTLQGQWEKLDPDAEVVALPTIEDARERVSAISEEKGNVHALVTGSFHLVGGFLSIFEGEDYGLRSLVDH